MCYLRLHFIHAASWCLKILGHWKIFRHYLILENVRTKKWNHRYWNDAPFLRFNKLWQMAILAGVIWSRNILFTSVRDGSHRFVCDMRGYYRCKNWFIRGSVSNLQTLFSASRLCTKPIYKYKIMLRNSRKVSEDRGQSITQSITREKKCTKSAILGNNYKY